MKSMLFYFNPIIYLQSEYAHSYDFMPFFFLNEKYWLFFYVIGGFFFLSVFFFWFYFSYNFKNFFQKNNFVFFSQKKNFFRFYLKIEEFFVNKKMEVFFNILKKKYTFISIFFKFYIYLILCAFFSIYGLFYFYTYKNYYFLQNQFSDINKMIYINFFNISTSFFFLILLFFFFSFYVFNIYTNFYKKKDFSKNFNFYFIPFIFLAQISLTLIFFTSNFIFIYIAIELFSIIIYYLISVESIDYKAKFYATKIFNTELSLRYFIISLFGSINLLLGIAFCFFYFGSFDIKIISMYFIPNIEGIEFFSGNNPNFGFILFIIGFCIKFGFAPYHFWINGIYNRFKNFFFQYMSIFPKSIVLCFFINFFSEFSICYPSEEKIFSLVFFFNLLGLFNVFFGTLSAYGQTDLKRLIMYSSLTNIGYIFFCISSNIENSFFIAYSYIIHYTLALFILFRIFNEIEFFTNKKFSQWNFSEFSSIPIKYKFFLTIIFFNLAGLPPFPLFFNKFFIFTNLWINKFFFNFIFMAIFSIIGYAYYFNFIKFIWFNEKFSYTNIFAKLIFSEKKTFKDIVISKYSDITTFFFWNFREGKFENIYWQTENTLDEYVGNNIKKFNEPFLLKYVYIGSNFNYFFFNKFNSFISKIEKIITRIFFYSFFISLFFINYLFIFFKKLLALSILTKYCYTKKFYYIYSWVWYIIFPVYWTIKKMVRTNWKFNVFSHTDIVKFKVSNYVYQNKLMFFLDYIYINSNEYIKSFFNKKNFFFSVIQKNDIFVYKRPYYFHYKTEIYENSIIFMKFSLFIVIFFIFFFIRFVSSFTFGPSSLLIFSNFIKRVFICSIYIFGVLIFDFFIFVNSYFFNFNKYSKFKIILAWIEYNIIIISFVVWSIWMFSYFSEFSSIIDFFRYILNFFIFFFIIFSYPTQNKWFNFNFFSKIKSILQFFIIVSIKLKVALFQYYTRRKNFFWEKYRKNLWILNFI